VPKGLYKINEENAKDIEAWPQDEESNFKAPVTEELTSLSSW
jgi:hypothetical protein